MTTWVPVVLAVVVVLLAAGWYLSFSAARLDRLHARVELHRSGLDAVLARRAGLAATLAGAGVLDPASALLLADAAAAARQAGEDGDAPAREAAESALSQALRAALDDDGVAEVRDVPAGAALAAELAAACRQAELARRFHNDAVRAVTAVRRQRLVRWAHLAGRAALPGTVELDDAPPPALVA